MEEEKRRKKNKKKKNKQSKTVEDGVAGVEELATRDQDLVNNGKDEHSQLSEATDEQSTKMDLNGQPPNGKECAISEVTIRKLKEENDVLIQKEAISKEIIRKLKEENDMHIQKKAISEESIRKLKEENVMHIQKEATLEETINRLRTENELQAKEQDNLKATLEMRIAQLQSEKDSLLQMKTGLEEKTNQLLNEKSVLSLKGESLQERINHLERDVAELEEYRNILLLENQQVKENVSGLQSKIQNLEKNRSSSYSPNGSAKDYASENEYIKSQIEAAHVLVENLVAENAELVEKVNELYMELDRRSAVVELSGASGTDGLAESAKHADVAIPVPESADVMSMSTQQLNPLEEVPVKDNSDTINAEHVAGVISSSSLVSEDSGEIVQIPLDDNEARNPELQAAQNVEEEEVPITDAPLIGAPFRLISFVAKYVSGADLVNQSVHNTNH